MKLLGAILAGGGSTRFGSDKALAYWFSDKVLHPPKPATPAKPPKPLMLADLPPACKSVLDAPARTVKAGLP